MDDHYQIAFGACSLNLRTRELRLHGRPQAVEPKIFDLIVLLVDRRHRVVTKGELLQALWPGRVVSDSAIARTVMQARKAVGHAALIKTVHRVGYRFAGDIDVPADAAASAPVPGLRLGILPMDNRTGDVQLEWTELGLAALVVQQLGADGRLAIVALPELLLATAPLPADTPVTERVAAATRLLGLQGCVHAALRRQGATLWLDYQGYGDALAALAGSLCGDEPALLAQRLADEVRSALALESAREGRFTSQDPFVQQAFARAGQMLALHQFRGAAKLLDVVIEFEPDSLPARLAHVRALANLEDASTEARADALARLAASRGDRRVQAQALHAAAHVHTLSERPESVAAASVRLTMAMRLTEPFRTEDWAVRLQLVSAHTAMLRGEVAQARVLYDRVEAASTDVNNQFQLALVLDQRAWMERECGEWLKAHGLLERVLQIYLTHNLRSTAALTLMNQAYVCTELGLMRRAADHARQSETLFASVQQPHAMASIAECAGSVSVARRTLADLDRILGKLTPASDGSPDITKAAWLAAQGMRAQCAGDFATARRQLERALAVGEAMQSPLRRARRLRQWLELEIEAADPIVLQTVQQRAQAFLAERDDSDLRALLARSRAAVCLQAGDGPGGLTQLLLAIGDASAGRIQALSRLDAAWLMLAAGRVAEARATVRGIGPWMEEHPLGRALASCFDGGPMPVLSRRLPSLA